MSLIRPRLHLRTPPPPRLAVIAHHRIPQLTHHIRIHRRLVATIPPLIGADIIIGATVVAIVIGTSSSLPSSLRASRGLRRFLVQMGVTLNKARLLPEIERSMNGQSPIQWWRNVVRAANNQDSRAVHEGFNLSMCLEAGKKVDYVREIIGRRLLGLKLVLGAGEKSKAEMWNKASAVLPLNSMTSISLPIQLMIDKHTRRSSRSTSFSASTTPMVGHKWPRRDGCRGPNQPSGGNGGDGTHGGKRYNNNKRFKSSHSGAPSASSNQGSSAGGSGAQSQ